MILAGEQRGSAQHTRSADSLARLPAHDRLLTLNAYLLERAENAAQKEALIGAFIRWPIPFTTRSCANTWIFTGISSRRWPGKTRICASAS
ncbi:MAG: hypothetical protein ABS46_10050 [Cytophagaceae bacterium SCN 52-12]|nr:MAG: hypothetical protein ABS46_10050 [Cytophagaceae bacterium SCN 52-12]